MIEVKVINPTTFKRTTLNFLGDGKVLMFTPERNVILSEVNDLEPWIKEALDQNYKPRNGADRPI